MLLFFSYWLAFNIALCLYSWWVIRRSKGQIKFIYAWGAIMGAFVWEDLFLISILHVLISIIVLVVLDVRIALLLLSIYWVVRSTGESAYFMLQQFLEPKHEPHFIDAHFSILRKIFGKISSQQCFILLQVFHQLHGVLWISILLLLIKFWDEVPPLL